MKPMRAWRVVAVVAVALVVAACSTAQVTPATTLNGIPPSSHPIPAVVTSATPAGWVPVDYGDAQISVPASFSTSYPYDQSPCRDLAAPGGALAVGWNGATGFYNRCSHWSGRGPFTIVEIGPILRSNRVYPPRIVVNGVLVTKLSNGLYLAPQLGVSVNAYGPLAHRILNTLTRSPRAVALAPGPARTIPSGWHVVRFDGVRFQVPKSWPINRTSWALPGIGGGCGGMGGVTISDGVTLSTDTLAQAVLCPAPPPLRMQRPHIPGNGIVVDVGRKTSMAQLRWSTSSHCVHINGLTACPATSLPYSVLVLKLVVPGRSTPVLVSIGLAGNGMVARTILHSLRAG
jgi:hypothetical protein